MCLIVNFFGIILFLYCHLSIIITHKINNYFTTKALPKMYFLLSLRQTNRKSRSYYQQRHHDDIKEQYNSTPKQT